MKIEPGWDVVILDPVRAEFPDIELTVDANSAYTLDDIDVLRKIDQFGLHYIEQPLHWDDLVDHAALAPQLDTPLCLDETLTSPARVKAALDLGACAVVNVKVGRVGGLAATKRIHDMPSASTTRRRSATEYAGSTSRHSPVTRSPIAYTKLTICWAIGSVAAKSRPERSWRKYSRSSGPASERFASMRRTLASDEPATHPTDRRPGAGLRR